MIKPISLSSWSPTKLEFKFSVELTDKSLRILEKVKDEATVKTIGEDFFSDEFCELLNIGVINLKQGTNIYYLNEQKLPKEYLKQILDMDKSYNIGKFLNDLRKLEPDTVIQVRASKDVMFGLKNEHSWRGNYECLAFETSFLGYSAEYLIGVLEKAIADETVYTGWKGGLFKMTGKTKMYIVDEESCTTMNGKTVEIVGLCKNGVIKVKKS